MSHYVSILDGMSSCSGEEDFMHIAIDFLAGDDNSESGILDVVGGHYKVEENATPDMYVKINPGVAYIKNSTSTKAYRTYLDTAVTNVAVNSNSTVSDRVDPVVLYIDTSASPDANASNVAKLDVLDGTGTSAMSDSAVQSALDSLVGESNVPWTRLADITVPDGATSITNSDISDTRSQIGMTHKKAVGLFSVTKTSVQSIPTSTTTLVTFDNENYDIDGWYDPTNSRYTPQKAGFYFFVCGIKISNLGDNRYYWAEIYKNGSAAQRLFIKHTPDTANSQATTGSALVYMNGNTDYVEIYMHHNDASTKNLSTTAHLTFWKGYFVGSI